jgi:protein O-mannosyl-transferase
MSLDSRQKQYIKKNLHAQSPQQMADYLGLPEKEITGYLKKRWRPEKYQKYINRSLNTPVVASFSFRKFFAENKFILGILFFLVIASYINSINNGFVSDDVATISNNPDLGKFFGYVLTSPIGLVQRVIYFIVFKLGGLNPVLFRLPNIFYHLGATFSLFLILYLTAPRTLAIMAAAIFAVHPIFAESITWISGNPYSLQGFLFLLFFAFYILSKQRPKLFYLAFFVFLLSVSALPRGAIALVAIFIYEWFFGNLKESWKKMLPFFIVSGIAAIFLISQTVYRINVLKDTYYLQPGNDSLLVKVPTSVFSYFHLLVWPDSLSLYQTEMIFTPWEYRFTVLVFLIYVGSIVYFYKKNKLLSFWLIFFILPLMPTLTPMRIAWAVAERYAYLSATGIIVVIAYIFYKLSEYKKIRTGVYMIFWLFVAALSVRTIVRNTDWKSEETLWFATAKTSPSGSTIHNNLGNVYSLKGDYEKSIEEFSLAIKINPAYGDAYHNIGNVYYQLQKMPEAAESYRKALELNPRLWQSHQNLAAVYYGQGWYDLAYEEIKKALEINPGNEALQSNSSLIESALQAIQASATSPAAGN